VTTGHRIGLLAAAVVVLIGAFVLFGLGGNEGGAEQTATPAEQPAATTPAGTGTIATTEAAPAPAPRVETIRVRDGQPAGEVRTLRYEDGDTIRLRFTSNARSEIHIHGYDEYVVVPAGGSGPARFEADAQGVFEIEDHGTGALLARLEVRP
jgi:FtsP/CotA-like multicopper oxidase with cupredoxin domain